MNQIIKEAITKLLSSENVGARVVWHAVQWDSCDGTIEELERFIKDRGEPEEIHIYKE